MTTTIELLENEEKSKAKDVLSLNRPVRCFISNIKKPKEKKQLPHSSFIILTFYIQPATKSFPSF